MRVHELARELRLTSKQVVTKAHDLGFDVSGTLATLTDEQVVALRQSQGGGAPMRPGGSGSGPSSGGPGASVPPKRVPGAPSNPAVVPGRRPVQPTPADPRSRPGQVASSTTDAARRRARPSTAPSSAAAVAERMRKTRARQLETNRPEEPGGDVQPSEAATETIQKQPEVARGGPSAQTQEAPPQRPQRPAPPPGRTGGPGRGAQDSGRGGQGGGAPDRRGGPPSGPARRGPGGPPQRGGGQADLIVPTIEVMKLDEQRRGTGAGGAANRKRGGGKGRPGAKREEGTAGEDGARQTRGTGSGSNRGRIGPSFVLPQPKRMPTRRPMAEVKKIEPKIVRIMGDMTMGQFADKVGVSVGDIMKYLMTSHAAMLNINNPIPQDLMEYAAIEFGVEIDIVPETDEHDVRDFVIVDKEEHLVTRPPVVTVMGHVDHGKTSLLDAIRHADVVAGEFGGITQHIGAYTVDTPKGRITFLDTPGHEAFTSMRARGARVTDLVILVVAADDPLMPQAIEAINHAREAGVPIIVAINKVDVVGANIQRVTNDLMGQGILSEAMGGDTIFVEVSAKKKTGIESLLEMILLQAEVLDLKANPDRKAAGTIIESRIDPQRGAVSTVLVQKGTLRIADHFVVGQEFGRIKAMFDDKGAPITTGTPSTPVEILGITAAPEAGEMFLVMPSEKEAREIAERRADRRRLRGLEQRQHVSLEGLKDMVDRGKIKELRIILKADVQGSLEAVRQSLERIKHEQINVRILHAATGGVNESDVNLADASDALIIGFNIRPETAAADLASHLGVEINTYQIIYALVDDVKNAIVGLIDKRYKELTKGRAEVREVFRVSKVGSVAGSYVASGEIPRSGHARLLRNNIVVWSGKIKDLRRYKDEVSVVPFGQECGISLEGYQDVKAGDEIEAFELEEIPVKI